MSDVLNLYPGMDYMQYFYEAEFEGFRNDLHEITLDFGKVIQLLPSINNTVQNKNKKI